MMLERGLSVDHTTVYRWVQRYAPELEKRCRPYLKACNDSWKVDETYIKGLCCKNKRAVISSASLREKAGASFMSNHSQNPFKWRHFQADIILLCIRWYLRYTLSYRDLEEMMLERGLSVDHTTIYRWVHRTGEALPAAPQNYHRLLAS
jgi:transposase-like protein